MDRQPLPEQLRHDMERAFSTEFSAVHVIESSPVATSMGARACAEGNDLHFAPGAFDPFTTHGLELIAHELVHVMHQRHDLHAHAHGGTTDPLEREADELGARAARGHSVSIAKSLTSDRAAASEGVSIDTGDRPRRQPKFAVQIERGNDAKIRAISFSGRTDSPFKKSMGAHTTAWVAHCDHVRGVLVGCTIAEATGQLALLRRELEQIAAWTWSTDFSKVDDAKSDTDEARKRFWLSRNKLAALLAAPSHDAATDVSTVQRAIAAYLEARNYLPLATIDSKKTGGSTEGSWRATMPELGGTGAIEDAWKLFDLDAALFAWEAAEEHAPGTRTKTGEQRFAMALAGHALAIRSAYPSIYTSDRAFLTVGAKLVDHDSTTLIDEALRLLASVTKVPHTAPASLQQAGSQAAAAEFVLTAGTLTSVNAGRPDSPFTGTQGAHTTAWVVHEDGLNTALKVGQNVPVKERARGLLHAIDQLYASPLARWLKHLPMSEEAARELLPLTGGEEMAVAQNALFASKATLKAAVDGPDEVPFELLQITAQHLLQVENLFPMATAATGHTNPGTGELSLRGLTGDQLEQAAWKDYDLASLLPNIQYRYENRREWDTYLRGVEPSAPFEQRLALSVAQHLFFVEAANPVGFKTVDWPAAYARRLSHIPDGKAIAKLACHYAFNSPAPANIDDLEEPDTSYEDPAMSYIEPSQDFDAGLLPAIEETRRDALVDYRAEQARKRKAKEERDKNPGRGRGRGRGRGAVTKPSTKRDAKKVKVDPSVVARGRGGGRGGRGGGRGGRGGGRGKIH